ncbi:hypothetical protein MA16_Dca007354 [Dendrobium catenatum]|uniref:Uncharacterized protein n=1 Tax=Dendrobium catenatum TaxID=906689 RepID=A0A2I0W8M5_9ASPA|nr:hypothetical protein MA16_Dca007354 [Dendrobium catenatum]
MRWRVWLGNIMEMYRTANPGMTVRPRPWPRGVGSSTELFSVKGSFGFQARKDEKSDVETTSARWGIYGSWYYFW